ncbi:hypothetical protein J6A31_09040 [bacterium]|nr:hypothetical protein [bacterium]
MKNIMNLVYMYTSEVQYQGLMISIQRSVDKAKLMPLFTNENRPPFITRTGNINDNIKIELILTNDEYDILARALVCYDIKAQLACIPIAKYNNFPSSVMLNKKHDTMDNANNDIPMENTDCEGACYNCPNKWTTTYCSNENAKYAVIIENIKKAIAEYGEERFWIPVDWEESDITAMRAWKKAREWIKEHGFVYTGITFRRWLVEDTNGKPVVSCGVDNGTVYIRKRMLNE